VAEHYESSFSFLESHRLRLIAATPGLIAMDLRGRRALAEALGVIVPPNWPPDLYDRNALEYAAAQLRDPAERNWSFRYLVERTSEPGVLVGICGFKGRPDTGGSVEIGYSMLHQYRNRGLATEAVSRLVAWAFSHGRVREVTAETLPHLRQSIRVMEKSGMRYSGPGSEHGVVRYAIQRSDLD
jgi:ribosomal-protein-alanine N-acetyltransferase